MQSMCFIDSNTNQIYIPMATHKKRKSLPTIVSNWWAIFSVYFSLVTMDSLMIASSMELKSFTFLMRGK